MNCLVTGAGGFIGHALMLRLANEGYHVRAMFHSHQPLSLPSAITPVIADITNPVSLSSGVHDIDVVFHCAAFVNDFGSKKQMMKVNVEGTTNLIHACEGHISRFIYLGHLPYESIQNSGYYTLSKARAEHNLLEYFHHHKFPVVIIRPGNVLGLGPASWVVRPLQAIQRHHIALIDHGQGIFLHTYIDNLVDALVAAMSAPDIQGEIIDVTDGDNSTTWGEYLNALASIAGKEPIRKNLSKNTALFISHLMMLRYALFRLEPWITPTAVNIFTNTTSISVEKAEHLLGYKPKIDYSEGIKRIHHWLKAEQYV